MEKRRSGRAKLIMWLKLLKRSMDQRRKYFLKKWEPVCLWQGEGRKILNYKTNAGRKYWPTTELLQGETQIQTPFPRFSLIICLDFFPLIFSLSFSHFPSTLSPPFWPSPSIWISHFFLSLSWLSAYFSKCRSFLALMFLLPPCFSSIQVNLKYSKRPTLIPQPT